MQIYKPMEEFADSQMFMEQDGSISTKEQIIKKYPILGTKYGVVLFATDSAGTIEDVVMMYAYENINIIDDIFIAEGADITLDMTVAEKCAGITEFVNNRTSDEEDALDSYLAM